ncbi:MAG: GGDEF domain-containing protein [Deltaproteobacteria bacterium]|nr:MAG: GGDEF domain-containing protein [Deltaproteobacteria bacterium]
MSRNTPTGAQVPTESQRVAALAGERAQEVRAEFMVRRRLAFEITLTVAAGILALSLAIASADDWFIRWIYPPFTVAFLVLAGLSRARRIPQATMELVGFGVGCALVLSRLVWHFTTDGALEERMVGLAGGLFWAVALLMAASFLFLDHRRGTLAAGAVLVSSAIITAGGLAVADVNGGFTGQSARELLRVHIFLVGLLVIVRSISVVQQRFLGALARAETLDHWARTDELTGLANRRAMQHLLERSLREAEETGRPFAVLLADLDHFKRINDTLGHAAGDEVLVHTARALSGALRGSDAVARWGGEEFLLLCPGSSPAQASSIAERCRRQLASEEIHGLTITATFGVSGWRDGDTIDSVVQRADRRLYAGKRAGRDRVVGADDPEEPKAAGHGTDTNRGEG